MRNHHKQECDDASPLLQAHMESKFKTLSLIAAICEALEGIPKCKLVDYLQYHSLVHPSHYVVAHGWADTINLYNQL